MSGAIVVAVGLAVLILGVRGNLACLAQVIPPCFAVTPQATSPSGSGAPPAAPNFPARCGPGTVFPFCPPGVSPRP